MFSLKPAYYRNVVRLVEDKPEAADKARDGFVGNLHLEDKPLWRVGPTFVMIGQVYTGRISWVAKR